MPQVEAAGLLMVQFLSWIAERPRSHADVMEAWRSSCPRFPVWEDALTDGLIRYQSGSRRLVALTQEGRARIATSGEMAHAAPTAVHS
jgi:hypothetical protein